MPDLKLVNQVGDTSKVYFSAYVELERDDGVIVKYRIVGADETNTQAGDISVDSPLAKALMKKEIDDEVFIKMDEKTVSYVILDIHY